MTTTIQFDEKNRMILECIREGLKSYEISRRVFLSPIRVRERISAMIQLTGTRDRASLLDWCYRNGFFVTKIV